MTEKNHTDKLTELTNNLTELIHGVVQSEYEAWYKGNTKKNISKSREVVRKSNIKRVIELTLRDEVQCRLNKLRQQNRDFNDVKFVMLERQILNGNVQLMTFMDSLNTNVFSQFKKMELYYANTIFALQTQIHKLQKDVDAMNGAVDAFITRFTAEYDSESMNVNSPCTVSKFPATPSAFQRV